MDIILNTYGTSLSVENGNFVILHKEGKQTIHPSKVKSIQIAKGARISSDAAILAIDSGIDVLFIGPAGMPVGRIWSVKYGSISNIRRNQLEFTLSPKAVKWIKEIVAQKFENQIALLMTLMPEDTELQQMIKLAVRKIGDYKNKVLKLEGEVVTDIAPSLRGWEGAASKVYFELLGKVVPTKYRFEGRSQHPARDLFNCMLNYAYGILYGRIEGALIKAGVDPYVGVFHRDDYNRPVLVFDVIEVFRVWADYVILNLCMQEAIGEECYSVKDDGSYWLENLGRRIVIQSMNDYLDEVIMMNGLERTRLTHIELYAQKLADMFGKM